VVNPPADASTARQLGGVPEFFRSPSLTEHNMSGYVAPRVETKGKVVATTAYIPVVGEGDPIQPCSPNWKKEAPGSCGYNV
jgi:hypothetical protein